MFHAQEDSIQAHVTIVFCALAISRHLQKATGTSIRRIVRALKPLHDVTVQVGGQHLVATTPPAGEAAEILATLHR